MWSSWMARSLGPPAGLAKVSAPCHLEERDGVAAADLEEVVAHRPGHRRGGQAHAEHADVEADGGVHVGGDEGQVVDALPARGVGKLVVQLVGHGINRTPRPVVHRRRDEIRVDLGELKPINAASLVAAGMLSVLFFPRSRVEAARPHCGVRCGAEPDERAVEGM